VLSANAATVHHPKPRPKPSPVFSQDFRGYPLRAYAAPRPDVHYDDTPSYNNSAKFGGGAP